MLFGCLCKLDMVVEISPQTFISTDLRRKYGDRRWAAQIEAIEDPDFDDLAPVMLDPACPATLIYVGEGDHLDVSHALHLAPNPRVSVRILEQCGHDAARHLRDRGILRQVLDELVSGRSASSE